jgi:hypothetical protein
VVYSDLFHLFKVVGHESEIKFVQVMVDNSAFSFQTEVWKRFFSFLVEYSLFFHFVLVDVDCCTVKSDNETVLCLCSRP